LTVLKQRRKPAELIPVMTRLPEALRKRLSENAERMGRSMNFEIIARLEESFRKDERTVDEARTKEQQQEQTAQFYHDFREMKSALEAQSTEIEGLGVQIEELELRGESMFNVLVMGMSILTKTNIGTPPRMDEEGWEAALLQMFLKAAEMKAKDQSPGALKARTKIVKEALVGSDKPERGAK
jgi:hypothetical protein